MEKHTKQTHLESRYQVWRLVFSIIVGGHLLVACDSDKGGNQAQDVNSSGSKSGARIELGKPAGSKPQPTTLQDEENGNESGMLYRSEREFEALARNILENPNRIHVILQSFGPGLNRRNFIQNALHEFSRNLSIPTEAGIALLKALDQGMDEEDVHAIRPADMSRIVERIGIDPAYTLVADLQTMSVKRGILDAVGRKYAQQGHVPVKEDLAFLDPSEKSVVYSTLGEETKFGSATEFAQFLERLDQSQMEYKTLADSALSVTHGLDSFALVEAAIQSGNSMVSSQVFGMGMDRMIKNDSLAASEYLARNKSSLKPELYQVGVQQLIKYLDRKGSTEELNHWKQELTNYGVSVGCAQEDDRDIPQSFL